MKKIGKLLNSRTQSLLLIAICSVIIALLMVCIIINNKDKQQVDYNNEPQAINEVIEESTEIVGDMELTPRAAPNMPEEVYVDPYEIIANDIEQIRNKDQFTIERYFGNSNVFTADTVADKLTATIVSFLSSEESDEGTKVVVHICTLDYDKMKDASNTIKTEIANSSESDESINIDDETKKEVAKGVVKGQFDLHYNIPVIVKNGKVIVSEEYKQALTGNWYHGVNTELQPVDCPLADK